MRSAIATVVLVLIGLLLALMVSEMPTFGQAGPAYNEVPRHYLDNSREETGAINVISAIILDYRAFDTLGEATVLFCGIAAVLTTLRAHRAKRGKD